MAIGTYIGGNFNEVKDAVVGAGFVGDNRTITLAGSSTNAVSMPSSLVFANNTTTDAGGSLIDGGFTITQLVETSGIRKVNMVVTGKGDTATSSLEIRQMGSFDGTTFFDIATSTLVFTSTSTSLSVTPRGTKVIPGLATTSISIPFEIDGFKATRFLFLQSNLSTDPNDGVQAYITVTPIEDIVR